jgi:hypothetical protein
MTAEQNAMATEKRMAGSGTSTNIAGADTFGSDAASAMHMIGSGKAGWLKGVLNYVTKPQNEAANAASLQMLTRQMKPGDLTRLQLQAQNRLVARQAAQAQTSNIIGRAAALPSNLVVQR